MTTAPYLVDNFINGTECVDECDKLEEAREFAEEPGGKAVKAEDYSPQDDGRAPLDEDAYLATPWLVDGWGSKAEWLYDG